MRNKQSFTIEKVVDKIFLIKINISRILPQFMMMIEEIVSSNALYDNYK